MENKKLIDDMYRLQRDHYGFVKLSLDDITHEINSINNELLPIEGDNVFWTDVTACISGLQSVCAWNEGTGSITPELVMGKVEKLM